MRIKEWMFKNGISSLGLAQQLNYDYAYIRTIVNESRAPGKKLASCIKRFTKGEVDMLREDYKDLPQSICDCCKRPI